MHNVLKQDVRHTPTTIVVGVCSRLPLSRAHQPLLERVKELSEQYTTKPWLACVVPGLHRQPQDVMTHGMMLVETQTPGYELLLPSRTIWEALCQIVPSQGTIHVVLEENRIQSVKIGMDLLRCFESHAEIIWHPTEVPTLVSMDTEAWIQALPAFIRSSADEHMITVLNGPRDLSNTLSEGDLIYNTTDHSIGVLLMRTNEQAVYRTLISGEHYARTRVVHETLEVLLPLDLCNLPKLPL